MALPLLYFNPLYWWLRAQVRLASELLADDWAAARGEKREYARQLIRFAEDAGSLAAAPAGVHSVLRSPSEFYRRLEMLMSREDTLDNRCTTKRSLVQVGIAFVIVITGAAFFGARPATAQEPEEEPPGVEIVFDQTPEQDASTQDGIKQLRDQNKKLMDLVNDLRHQLAAMSASRSTKNVTPWGNRYPRTQRRVRVQTGDTPLRILKRHGLGRKDLGGFLNLNPGLRSNRLRPGQFVNILSAGGGLLDVAEEEPEEEPEEEIVEEIVEEEATVAEEMTATESDESAGSTSPNRARNIGDPETGRLYRRNIGFAGNNSGSFSVESTLSLVTKSIDLQSELQLAEAELGRMQALRKNKAVTRAEFDRAQIKLSTAHRKFKLVTRLIESEIEASRIELEGMLQERDLAKKMDQRRPGLDGAVMRLRSRIEILGTAR